MTWWVAVLVFLGLVVLITVGGYALHYALHYAENERLRRRDEYIRGKRDWY